LIFILIAGLILSLLLSAFFSGSESGFYFVSKGKLSVRAAQGEKRAERLLKLLARPGEIISTMLIGNNVALQLGTTCAMLILVNMEFSPFDIPYEILTTLLLFLPFFVFGEVMPKVNYRLYAEELLLLTYPLIQFFRIAFFPFTWMVKLIAKLLEHWFGVQPITEATFDRQHMSLNLGHAFSGGELSEEQVESLAQVLNASDYPVEQVMLNLLKAPKVSIESSMSELREMYLAHPEKAYPVYSGKKNNFVGTVDVHKLVMSVTNESRPIVKALMPMVSIEAGRAFRDALPLFFEQNAALIFVTRVDRVIGVITWKRALLLLLR